MLRQIKSSLTFMLIVSLALTTFALGCKDDDGPQGPPVRSQDGWEIDAVDTTEPPTEEDVEEDVVTGPPGFMHGEWEVRQQPRTAEEEERHIYTLMLTHIEGETVVTGTILDMFSQETTRLSPGSWRSDSFEVSWAVRFQGGERSMFIADAARQTDDLLTGDYNDRRVGQTFPVQLVRKP